MRQKGARLQTYIKRQTDDGIGPCARLRLSRLIIGGAAEPWPFSAAGPPQETKAGTSIIRQLVDAGTLSNLPGGLKARGMRIKGDDTPISPGEWRDVDIPSGSLRENFFALPYKEPSATLAGLLTKITEDGRRLAGIAELEVSDMSAQAPVGTTLALLERQLKTMSAVQARVHSSLRMEFKLLKEIIRDFTPSEYTYTPEGGDRKAKQSDY
ncbi:MAG: hypothetical protein EBX70_07260, partial [Betaproteobacteria bacterium]|nr:hypothetical protein [Betaproteobacteria bacterium]